MADSIFSHVVEGIWQVVNQEESFLSSLNEEMISSRVNKQSRTIKQILGHLIDSASNNHQRMVRLQYNKNLVFPDYRQDNDLWIALQDYQHANWKSLIQLWKYYNLHIIQVINSINLSKLHHYWYDYEGEKVTLKDMIEGYLSHLYLHINEIHELYNS